jgi:mono/diheme cytochrome c family protein
VKQLISIRSFVITMVSVVVVIYSCSKSDGGSTPPPNPCTGVTITVSAATTNPTSPTANDGSITALASGSSGFTFSINGGTFQSSGSFTNLAPGSYTITAKNGSGCTGSASFTLANPCAGVTITVSGAVTNPASAVTNNGSIAATATGSTGFTFNINGGTFQSSGTFTGLAAGSYTIIAKNGGGCTGSASFTLTAPNVCSGVTITVNNTATGTTPCETNTGIITASASGGAGSFTYSLNSGAFQSSNIFSNLAAGSYTVTAKDANGCTGVSAATTVSNLTAGTLFDAVRTLVQTNCVSCHSAAVQNGGMNFAVDCNIVNNKDRIKARAVDGNPSAMPQGGLLPAAERQKITDWINAGGKFTN